MPVDIVADAAHLPLEDESQDYVLSSHQLEHSWDTLGAIEEWVRVLRPATTRSYPWSGDPVPEMGGFLYIVLPHRSPHEANEPTTTLVELIARHGGTLPPPQDYLEGNRSGHRCFWSAQDFLREIVPYLCHAYSLQLYAFETHDCRVGNGFTLVLQKIA